MCKSYIFILAESINLLRKSSLPISFNFMGLGINVKSTNRKSREVWKGYYFVEENLFKIKRKPEFRFP